MKPANEIKLYDKYPTLFFDNIGERGPKGTLYGFDCGDGWLSLIIEACDYIVNYESAHPEEVKKVGHIHFVQIKEKFGTLTIYVDQAPEEVIAFLDDVRKRSKTVCEHCGKAGKIRPGGWIMCLCDECHGEPRADVVE